MTLTVPNELGNIIVATSCFLETTHISINNLFANRLMHFQIFEVHPMRTSFLIKFYFPITMWILNYLSALVQKSSGRYEK